MPTPNPNNEPMTLGAAIALIVSSLVGIGGFIKAYMATSKQKAAEGTVSNRRFKRLVRRVATLEAWRKSGGPKAP